MSKRLIDANELISAMYYYEHNEGGLTAYDAQDIINKAPTIEPKAKVVAQVTFDEEKMREIVKEAVERFKEEYEIEPKRGEWKPFDLTWGRSVWYCTACEESVEVPCDIWTHKPIYNFCPNCGAEMKGADDE